MTARIAGLASYLPERWMTAAEIATASGIPEPVVVDKFGLRGKHIAAADEHVSDMAVIAGRRALDDAGLTPADIDAVVYFGSTWKDHPVWHASPHIARQLGCVNAFALELDYVSCGTPVALRICRDMLVAEPAIRRVLAVAASRESHLLDYGNRRSRFAFNFGDGAVAAVLSTVDDGAEIGATAMITDGSFSHQVRVPAGGSVEPTSAATIADGRHLLDVADPISMKDGLDAVSLPNFRAVASRALAGSGREPADVDLLCLIHMKRSMHDEILDVLGVPAERSVYLDDTGHMSGVDPLLALDRRRDALSAGDTVLLLAAGTGYTWAASTLTWRPTGRKG
ncbi:3-oxoacyl-ACP synthase [Stackebrandtia soli]|uniref:3-oxoacyl-ACP synthase n=1 Tax=Stackebrandtia soli TaxID=1892856 RepID=UPI0039E7D8E4